VALVRAEGQIEEFRRLFLCRGGLKIGVIERAMELEVPR
jgi:hypothetical protein